MEMDEYDFVDQLFKYETSSDARQDLENHFIENEPTVALALLQKGIVRLHNAQKTKKRERGAVRK